MADIFISYARADRALVTPIRDALAALDLDLFFDAEGIYTGDQFPDVLDREVRAARVLLGCLSDHALTRDWVKDECRLAKELGKLALCEVAPVTAADVPLDFRYVHREGLHPFDAGSAAWARTLLGLGDKLRRFAEGAAKAAAADARAKAERLEAAARAVLGAPEPKPEPEPEPERPSLARAAIARFLRIAPTPAAPTNRLFGEGGGGATRPAAASEPELRDDAVATEEFSQIADSLNPDEYDEFARFFDGTTAGAEAARRRDRLRAWEQVDHTDARAIEAFAREDDFPALKAVFARSITAAEDARRRAWRARVAKRRSEEMARAPAGTVFRDPVGSGVGPEMCVIPAGSFRMGSPPDEAKRKDWEGPQIDVTVAKPFALGRYAVTFDEYDAYCAATGAERPDAPYGRGRQPAIHVSWEDAQGYCAWLSDETGAKYRLPSEAEWEYACRAGTATRYWMGDDIDGSQAHYVNSAGAPEGRSRSIASRPIRGACFRCTAMFGSGAKIAGIRPSIKRLKPVRRACLGTAPEPFCAAVLGSSFHSSSAPLIATGTHAAAGTYPFGFRVARTTLE